MDYLIILLIVILGSVVLIGILLIWYILLMKVIKRWGKSNMYVRYLGILPFALFDFLCNTLPVTVLSMDLPRELLVTRRLVRYRSLILKEYTSLSYVDKLRLRLSDYMCDEVLDPYDTITGDHC